MKNVSRFLLLSFIVSLPLSALAADDKEKSSSVACYFNNGKAITWRWGLTTANKESFYSFPGEWKKTEYTKQKKFFSPVSYAAVFDSCTNAKKFYKEEGAVFAMFAAVSDTGANYPIVLGGTELYPNF